MAQSRAGLDGIMIWAQRSPKMVTRCCHDLIFLRTFALHPCRRNEFIHHQVNSIPYTIRQNLFQSPNTIRQIPFHQANSIPFHSVLVNGHCIGLYSAAISNLVKSGIPMIKLFIASKKITIFKQFFLSIKDLQDKLPFAFDNSKLSMKLPSIIKLSWNEASIKVTIFLSI